MHRIRMAVRENRLRTSVVTEEHYVPAIETLGRGWVAEVEGRIVGFAIGNGETGNIWALFVDPEHEGRGHGRALHDVMVEWLFSRGLRHLWLGTDPGTRAERFYRAAGWRHTGNAANGEALYELANPGMAQGFSLSVHEEISAEEARAIDQGLDDSNAAAAPLHEVRPLHCVARSADGTLIGGAKGRTWGQCCELRQLWVHPAHRLKGIGTRLLRKFEEAAAARGCSVFYLDTFSFQARPFYERLGYEARLEIRGFGPGIAKYIMVRGDASGA